MKNLEKWSLSPASDYKNGKPGWRDKARPFFAMLRMQALLVQFLLVQGQRLPVATVGLGVAPDGVLWPRPKG